jgi:hypothetical protein
MADTAGRRRDISFTTSVQPPSDRVLAAAAWLVKPGRALLDLAGVAPSSKRTHPRRSVEPLGSSPVRLVHRRASQVQTTGACRDRTARET